MRFSAEQALDAHEEGEPIMVTQQAARKMIQSHGLGYHDFVDDVFGLDASSLAEYDAWTVLEWLGY